MQPPVSVIVFLAASLAVAGALFVYVLFLFAKLWRSRRILSVRGQFLLSVAVSSVAAAVAVGTQYPSWDTDDVVILCEIAGQRSLRRRRCGGWIASAHSPPYAH